MTVSGFLSKTFDIFSDPANAEICSWGANGETIHVKKIDEFSKTILPKYFKHSNFQSFVRQLNMYDFHKTVQDPGNGEFTHVNFRKNRPDLLSLIKRKAHNKQELRAKQQQQNRLNAMAEESGDNSSFPPSSSGSSSGAPLPSSSASSSASVGGGQPQDSIYMMAALEQEQAKQKRIREDFEWRLSQLEAQKARIYELEAQQGRLSGENYMLKHMLQDSRAQQNQLQSKMEGVLKLMYHAFVNNGSNNVPAIGNGIPESRLLEFCSFLNVANPPVLKLETVEDLGSADAPASSSSTGAFNDSSVTAIGENDLLSNEDINDFLHNGEISSDLMTSGPANNGQVESSGTLKRKLQPEESVSEGGINNGGSHIASAGASSSSTGTSSDSSSGQTGTEVTGGDGQPVPGGRLQKLVSFDSLAGNIRPQTRPPLSSPSGVTNGNGKANGGVGISGSPAVVAGTAGAGAGGVAGGMLSRQHSLELPEPGQSISGGYHYTPLSSAHGTQHVKRQKMEPDVGEYEGGGMGAVATGRRMEGQGLSRLPSAQPPSLGRQDSEESLGLPLGHMDSMDSTLASLFDISDPEISEEHTLD